MSKVKCPICDAAMPGNWTEYPEYPFCTKRCKLVDLGRWLGEGYTVSGDDRGKSTPGQSGDDHAPN